MRRRQGGKRFRVATDEHQVRDQSVAIGQRQSAFRGDRQEIAHVLDRSHATGGAVDDDADILLSHVPRLSTRVLRIWIVEKVCSS